MIIVPIIIIIIQDQKLCAYPDHLTLISKFIKSFSSKFDTGPKTKSSRENFIYKIFKKLFILKQLGDSI
jgi:hypothetical protein